MSQSPRVLMLFLDGVGIGRKNSSLNPFFATPLKSFEYLMGGSIPHLRDNRSSTGKGSLVPLNATLGVPGLPQSGTGQTALLTGKNASKFIGRHFGPYPFSTLRPVLQEHNLFRTLKEMGKCPYYVNAFPQRYFDYFDAHKSRMSAIAYAWESSGNKLNTAEILRAGNALSADITNERWNKLGFPAVPVITPQAAGRKLVELTERYDFVFYEYYLTDKMGHSQSMQEAKEIIGTVDGLLEGILQAFDPASMLLIVTSDHGNLEDLSTKSHTRNPVPLVAFGKGHEAVTKKAKNLTHIKPAIVEIFE